MKMGFLKRLFSLGIKKNKKRIQNVQHIPLPEQAMIPTNDEEHEAAVGKLLRSTSARFVEAPALDYATLPPIPHPINKVLVTPASSTLSVDTASLSQRGTYNVTVHRRRRHASTDFPDANRDLDDQSTNRSSLHPAEDSRVLRLRSDPSVASLLELYDEHGRVSNDAFSNDVDEPSPPKLGRAQVRRNGSTLRQLLGATSANDGAENSEGDISWAEKFLGESDATSIASSSGVRTPDVTQFPQGTSAPEVSIVSDLDLSACTFDNPAVSSMEVEVNDSYDLSRELDRSVDIGPYVSPDPTTPRRASQIFGFLTKGKQSKPPVDLDRTLPQLPSCFSSPSEESASESKWLFTQRESYVNNSFNPKHFSAPIPPNNDTQSLQDRPCSFFIEQTSCSRNRLSQEPRSAFSDDTHEVHDQEITPFTPQHPKGIPPSEAQHGKQNDIRVLMTGPTKVIVTAPTPGTNPPELVRGSRSLARRTSSGSRRRRSVLKDVSSNSSPVAGDPFVIVSPKQKIRPERRNSTSSSFSRREYEDREDYISLPKKPRPVSPGPKANMKENHHLCLSVNNDLPSTPLRSNTSASSRSYARNLLQQGAFGPDANLSSELSPVGRQLMNDVRQQRSRAREAERHRFGNRF